MHFNQEIDQKIKEILGDVLELPVTSMEEDLSIHTHSAWDSLSHLNIVLAVQQAFSIKFTTREIPMLTSLESLKAAVKSKTAEGSKA